MSRPIHFTLPIIELASLSGHTVVMPLGFTDTFQIGVSAEKAADYFRRAVQKQLLQTGWYLEFMQLLHAHSYRIDSFRMEVVADPAGDLFPPQWIEFDYLHWQSGASYLGLVPVLGVGASGSSIERLVEQLESSVSLYLFKQRLTRSISDLIPPVSG